MNENLPTVSEIEEMVKRGELREHHTAANRGYISRKAEAIVGKYSGKFGEGYTVSRPRWDTTQYYYVTYYVRQ